MQYKIHIPAPCHESWDKMSPTEKGRFCTLCEKEVQDFTTMTESQILLSLKGKDAVCGRLTSKQLQKTPFLRERSWSVNWGLAIGLSAFLLVSFPIYGQSNLDSNRLTIVHEIGEVETVSNGQEYSLIFKGTVLDDEEDPLPFTNVIIKKCEGGNWINLKGTTTDLDGNFLLFLDVDLKSEKLKIEISYVGYEEVEMPLDFENREIQVVMKEDENVLPVIGLMDVRPMNEDMTKGAIYYREGNGFRRSKY